MSLNRSLRATQEIFPFFMSEKVILKFPLRNVSLNIYLTRITSGIRILKIFFPLSWNLYVYPRY
jgi:hypothetical protein